MNWFCIRKTFQKNYKFLDSETQPKSRVANHNQGQLNSRRPTTSVEPKLRLVHELTVKYSEWPVMGKEEGITNFRFN